MIISHKYKFIFIKTSKVGGTSVELFLSQLCDKKDIITPLWHSEEDHTERNHEGYFNPIPEVFKRFVSERKIIHNGVKNTLKDLINREKYFESIPAWQIKCRVPSQIWNNYYKFTIERNPWDKAVSRYFHSKAVYEEKYKKKLTFDNWLAYFSQRLNKPWLTRVWGSEAPYNYPRYADPWNDEILVDKICSYENLNDELSNVFSLLKIPFNGDLGYRAKSDYRKEKTHYKNFLNNDQIEQIYSIFEKEIKIMKYKY